MATMAIRYIQDVLATVKREDAKEKIIFITVGPSGSGKSHMAAQLASEISDLAIHSLDDYRIKCNNGEYPQTPQIHDRVNQVAIPMYRDSVLKDSSRFIVLDNTHLRWDPDWQLPIQKAKREGYDIFPIVPPVTEHFLHTCRSTHIGTGQQAEDIFRKMCARWPGFRMAHLLHRRISCDTLDDIFPSKPDSFSVNKMFHINWGENGYLYVVDNYLGYVDHDMIMKSIKAGNHIKKMTPEAGSLFLQKDSLLHITLIPPGKVNTDVLRTIARNIATQRTFVPNIEYVGVQDIKDLSNGNRLLFLCISENSNEAWKNMVDSVARKKPSVFNPDGIHVTLGFTKSDMWGIKKTILPKWTIKKDEWDILSETFEWSIKEPLTAHNFVDESILVETLKQRFPDMEACNISEAMRDKLSMLLSHPEVKHKWKDTHSINTSCVMGKQLHHRFHIMNFVVSPTAKFRSDDETYKRYNKLLRILPRGLTIVFDHIAHEGTVRYVNAVYPTPKFFGDNDLKEDVEIITDRELQIYAGTKEAYIVTEKVNGEMFTFTVVYKDATDPNEGVIWLIAMGSKNNKYIFKLHTDFVEDCVDEGIQVQLKVEGKFAGIHGEKFVR